MKYRGVISVGVVLVAMVVLASAYVVNETDLCDASDGRLLALWTLHVVAGACALLQLGILSTLLRDREERFRRLSTVDPLTGISNRRHFLERLADEWNRSIRHGSSFALALVDLDRVAEHLGPRPGEATVLGREVD